MEERLCCCLTLFDGFFDDILIFVKIQIMNVGFVAGVV